MTKDKTVQNKIIKQIKDAAAEMIFAVNNGKDISISRSHSLGRYQGSASSHSILGKKINTQEQVTITFSCNTNN